MSNKWLQFLCLSYISDPYDMVGTFLIVPLRHLMVQPWVLIIPLQDCNEGQTAMDFPSKKFEPLIQFV